MSQLSLWFAGSAQPELFRCSFNCAPLGLDQMSVRGNGSSLGTFRWSTGVKALGYFFVSAALAYEEGESETFSLEGERGTLVSSLDFALGKEPEWLNTLCGFDSEGRAAARRLILRGNPEGKRPGPFSLSLNQDYLSPGQVRIFWNDRRVIDAGELSFLASSLVGASNERSDITDWLYRIMLREAKDGLLRTDIFCRSSIVSRCKRVMNDPSFRKVSGNIESIIDEIDLSLSAAQRLGLAGMTAEIPRELESLGSIEVCVASPSVGSIAIFNHLMVNHNLNLRLNTDFPHAVDVLKYVMREEYQVPPGIICLGEAPAATFLGMGAPGYHPLMFLPNVDHRVVSSNPGSGNDTFMMMCDEPSTASFYFEDLKRSGELTHFGVEKVHKEPFEVFMDLKGTSEAVKAVLFFPYYDANLKFNNCVISDCSSSVPTTKEKVLFVHESIYRDSVRVRLLNVAIRNAWLELIENEALLGGMVGDLIKQPGFVKSLKRFTGIAWA